MRWIWIDRFLEFRRGKSARAIKNLSLAEDIFADHFPGYPIMPGSLILEGLAQTGGILVGDVNDFRDGGPRDGAGSGLPLRGLFMHSKELDAKDPAWGTLALATTAPDVTHRTDWAELSWGDTLLDDPAYNPNLSLDAEDFSLAWPPRVRKPWQ